MKRKLILWFLVFTVMLAFFGNFTQQSVEAVYAEPTWVEEVGTWSNLQFATVDSVGRTYVLTGTSPYLLYKSVDNGATWTLMLNTTNAIRFIYIDHNDYVYVYLVDVWRSTDYGATWDLVLDTTGISQLWHMDEDSVGRIYVNTYDSDVGDNYIYRSNSSGLDFQVWHNITEVNPSVRHYHGVDVDPNNDYVWGYTGDADMTGSDDNMVFYYDGSTWNYIRNSTAGDDSESRWTAMCFVPNYVISGPDGSDYIYRLPSASPTWNQRDKSIEQATAWGTSTVFWATEVYDEGIAFIGSRGGKLVATWDGLHWVKVWDYSTAGVMDLRLPQEGRFPFYFVDATNSKLYRVNYINREDLVHLYYSEFNSIKGSIVNAATYTLEQRIQDGTEYIDLSGVALSSVQASIKGLTKYVWLNNSGWETGNKTGWAFPYGEAGTNVTNVEAWNGSTYSLEIVKNASDSLETMARQVITVSPGENLLVFSFAYKCNVSGVASAVIPNLYNSTSGSSIKLEYLTSQTSWTNVTWFVVVNSTSQWAAEYRVRFGKKSVTTYVDGHLFQIPEVGYSRIYENDFSIYNYVLCNDTRFYSDIDTLNPTVTIGSQSISHSGTLTNGTESSSTSLTGIITGAVEVTASIAGSKQAILKLTGTRILYEDSMILQGRTNGVYYGRYYGTWSPTTTTDDLIAVTNLEANITSFSVTTDLLKLNIVSPNQTTSVTYLHCGSRGKPISVSGTTSWSYNSNTNIATLNVAHSSVGSATIRWSFATYIPPSRYDYEQETWYLRYETWNVSGVLGYMLHETQSGSSRQINITSASLATFQVGIRIYTVTTTGTETEVTSGTPVAIASRSGVGEATENATWTPSETISFPFDSAIKVVYYYKIGSGSWTAKIVGVSRQLVSNEIEASTWTVYYHMRIATLGANYDYRVYFGEYTEWTRIEDISIAMLDPWGKMLYYLNTGDIVSWITSPFTYHIGDLFYGFVVMFLAVTSYNRYRRLGPLLVIMFLFGGVGGAITLLIPGVGLNVSFLLLGLALALTFFKLIH